MLKEIYNYRHLFHAFFAKRSYKENTDPRIQMLPK